MKLDHATRLCVAKNLGVLAVLFGCAFTISACGIGLGLYMMAFFLQLLTKAEYDWRPYPRMKYLAFLLAALLISVFTSDYFAVSVRGYWKYLEGFIILYAICDVVRCSSDLKNYITALTAILLLAALCGVSQSVFGVDFVYFREGIFHHISHPPRLIGSFKFSNDFSAYLIPAIPLSIGLILNYLYFKRRAGYLIFGILLGLSAVYSLWGASSRGSLLSLMVALGVMGLFTRYRLMVPVLAVALLAAVWFIPSSMSDRLHELAAKGGSLGERMILLQTAVAMIQAGPLFGLGLNTYSMNFHLFRPEGYDQVMYAHNGYLQMGAEAGLVGVFLYLLFIFMVILRSVRSVKKSETKLWLAVFVSSASGVLFNGLFESIFQSTQLRSWVWALLGFIASLALIDTKKDGSA